MAATTQQLAADVTSNANFRAWGLFIKTAILAGGWVLSSDTGQIDFTTVTSPVGINTSAGYNIFQSQDASGGLNNYYVKLEYGSYTAVGRQALWATVGWATNGSGSIDTSTYPSTVRNQFGWGEAPPAGSPFNNCSARSTTGGAGHICYIATKNGVSTGIGFGIERTRDSSNNFKDEVMFINHNSGSFANNVQVVNRNNVYPSVNSGNNIIVIPQNANTPIAAKAGLGLVFGQAPGNTSPSMNFFGVEQTAIGQIQDSVGISILGVTHQYKIQDLQNTFGQATTQILARYE